MSTQPPYTYASASSGRAVIHDGDVGLSNEDSSNPWASASPVDEQTELDRPPPIRNETVETKASVKDASSLSGEDIVIAIMGVTGSGKSSFISLLADQSVAVGHGLESCTTDVTVYSLEYDSRRTVYLIDTPGFDDTNRSDTDILKDIAFFLSKIYVNKVRLAGIIYLHRITDPRMGGSALKNLYMFQRLCGDRGLGSVILATTMWSGMEGSEELGRKREEELSLPQFWGSMADRGSRIVRHDGTSSSATAIISSLVEDSKQVVLDIQVQLVEEEKSLDQTAAGQYIQKDLMEARRRFEKDIAEYQESMEAAIQENDHAMLEALKKEKKAAEAKEMKRQEDFQKLNITVQQLSQEKDEEYQKIAEMLQADHQIREQLQFERESQSKISEAHIRELQKLRNALQDSERRHQQELNDLKRSQIGQVQSEMQRLNQLMTQREALFEKDRMRLQQDLYQMENREKEKKIRKQYREDGGYYRRRNPGESRYSPNI